MTVRNTAIDWTREYKRIRQEIDADSLPLIDCNLSVADKVENKIRNEKLYQAAILELKPEYQSLIIKFYLEEKSYKDLCAELYLTEQVIAQRLARARKKLLKHFIRKWNV